MEPMLVSEPRPTMDRTRALSTVVVRVGIVPVLEVVGVVPLAPALTASIGFAGSKLPCAYCMCSTRCDEVVTVDPETVRPVGSVSPDCATLHQTYSFSLPGPANGEPVSVDQAPPRRGDRVRAVVGPGGGSPGRRC
jgi:hypothetical protein